MSFRTRLMITFSLLISFTFGIGSTLLISTSFDSYLEEKKSSMLKEFETLQNNILLLDSFNESSDYNNLRELLSQMEQQKNAHWSAIRLSTEESVLFESGNKNHLHFDLALENADTYAYVHTVQGDTASLQMYSELPLRTDILYLKASFDLSSAYQLRKQQQQIFVVIYSVVILLSLCLTGVISHLMTKRLKHLTDTAQMIGKGNLAVRSDLKTGDEFEQLSIVLDRMTDTLSQTIKQLEKDVEQKESFMGAVAHEIKTPMTSIIGYADMIRQCSLTEEEQMMAANYIYSEGKRLENLSHKILDLLLMEKDSFDMKMTPVSIFLKDVKEMLLPTADEKNVSLLLECENSLLPLETDLAKSLFYNLIENGIKATPAGGSVQIHGRIVSNGYEIQITDTGCGMEAKEIERITEAFYRIDKSRSRSQGGVGLGLTLCKKIIDLHHGNMTFHSKPGNGSTVTVWLPTLPKE